MKQAILITAYKNFRHLVEIIHFFDDNFHIYLHIDQKSEFSREQLLSLKSEPRVELVSQRYKVNWGSLNHLQSILHLIDEALKHRENNYFHLISGHDFPIKSKAKFLSYFEQNRNKEYMSFFNVPKPGWADNEGMDRLEYYNFYDLLNAKIPLHNHFIRKSVILQKKLNIRRNIPEGFPVLYGGSTWWSLSRPCLEYVMKYTKENRKILKRFKHTLCSEEFYFQTVVLNSPFAQRVVNDNLRYIDWVARNGNNPAVLDITDLPNLTRSNAFFARKFDFPVSSELFQKIKKEVKSSKNGKSIK